MDDLDESSEWEGPGQLGTGDVIMVNLKEYQHYTNDGCCVSGCRNANWTPEAVYFSLPERPSTWLEVLKEHLSTSKITDRTRICSDHFRSSDIIRTADEPTLAPGAIPRAYSTNTPEVKREENPKKAMCGVKSIAKVKVEAVDPHPPKDLHQLHLDSGGERNQTSFSVKMEFNPGKDIIINPGKDIIINPGKDIVMAQLESPDKTPSQLGDKMRSRNVKINVSSNKIQKYLKDGKLEKLPDGTYRVLENVLKDLEHSSVSEEISESNVTLGLVKSHNTPSNEPNPVKRKRGRPRKGTVSPCTSQETASAKVSQTRSPSTRKNIFFTSTHNEDTNYESTETDNEIKTKRKRRSKILDDYVADFNTSEEEDAMFNSRTKYSPRGRGRGRGRRGVASRVEEDVFSNHVGLFSKKFTLLDDFAIDDDDPDEDSDSDEMVWSPDNQPTQKTITFVNDESGSNAGIEIPLGPEGKTKVKIVETGETSVVNGEENLIYHVVTTTGGTSTVTPITIPKEASGDDTKEEEPSTSEAQVAELEAAMQEEEGKLLASRSRKMQSQRLVRSYNQKVSAMRQQYSKAVEELRRRKVYTLADLVCGASRFLTEEQLVFFTLQLKSGCHNMQGVRFSAREKILALAFYLQNPSMYKWLRALFHLPTKLILERWLESIAKCDPDTEKKLMYFIYTNYIFK